MIGPTGKFPLGKINKHDEGELGMAIYNNGTEVFMDFGKRTTWIAFPAALARQLAAILIHHADELDKKSA